MNAKEKCSKEGLKCYFSEHTSDKKMKEADGGYGEIFSGLNRRSNQPNIPLICTEKPKICVTSFIVIFDSLWWSGNQNHNISEVCLYTKGHEATRNMGVVPTYV